MVQHSKLIKEEKEKERGVILEEINLYEDTPSRKIGDIYESLLYGDTPMGWDIAGEKDVIRKITREDFLDYMGSLYSPSNMTVVVAGGIDSEKGNDQVKKYFREISAFYTLNDGNGKTKKKKHGIWIIQKQTQQI